MEKNRGAHVSPGIYYKNDDIEYANKDRKGCVLKTLPLSSYSAENLSNGTIKLNKTGNIISFVYFGKDAYGQVLSTEKSITVLFQSKDGVDSYIAIPNSYEISKIYSIPDEKDSDNIILVYDKDIDEFEDKIFEDKGTTYINGAKYTIYGLIYESLVKSDTKYKIELNKI